MSSQADRRGGGPAAAPGRLRRWTTRSSFVSDLRVVLAERNFRRLFATRLISQTGDGVFTAGLGSYVFFNATKFPDPASAAGAFAVLYLPYSLIGPFAGVFIDRWSRRQILVWSAVIRAAFVALTAVAGGLGQPGCSAVRQRPGGAGRRPVLPVLAVGRAAARGGGRQAGDGQLRGTDRGRHHGLGRRPGRAGRAPGDRRRPGRLGRHVAGRRGLLRAGRAWSPPPCAGSCSARTAPPASRCPAGCSPSWPRSPPDWPPAPGMSGAAGARRPRSAPPGATGSCTGSCS